MANGNVACNMCYMGSMISKGWDGHGVLMMDFDNISMHFLAVSFAKVRILGFLISLSYFVGCEILLFLLGIFKYFIFCLETNGGNHVLVVSDEELFPSLSNTWCQFVENRARV